jgi:hypothetical protein
MTLQSKDTPIDLKKIFLQASKIEHGCQAGGCKVSLQAGNLSSNDGNFMVYS